MSDISLGVLFGMIIMSGVFGVFFTGFSKVVRDYLELLKSHSVFFVKILDFSVKALLIIIPLAFNDVLKEKFIQLGYPLKIGPLDLTDGLPYIVLFFLIFSLEAFFVFIKGTIEKRKEKKISERILKQIQKKYFGKFLDQARLTLFVEDFSLIEKFHLRIFSRVGVGDEKTTWKIDPINANNCQSLAGKTWYDENPRSKNDLPTIAEVTQMLDDPNKKSDLDGYLRFLSMDEKILRKRIKENRSFPVSIMACPIKLASEDKKAVLVIDSEDAIDLPDESEFIKELSNLSIILDNM